MCKLVGSVLLLMATQTSAAAAESSPSPIVLRTLTKKDLPSWVKVAGPPDNTIGWTDKNGQNVLVFFSRRTTRKRDEDVLKSYALTVEHQVSSGGPVRTLRTVRDQVEKCELDLVAEVDTKNITVTDVDGDGVGEVTFAYTLGCRSDASSDTLKLLLLQGTTKYILRGETVVEVPDEGLRGGEYKADPLEAKWPKPLLDHAKKMWKTAIGQ